MSDTDSLAAQRLKLRHDSRPLAGDGVRHPAEEFEAVAAWLRDREIQPDMYGNGPLVEDFERELAEMFGKPAARFMPSGCMAQPIALRVWADRAGNMTTGFHPTSHLELHEEHGYRALHGLQARLIGEADRPIVADDLHALSAAGEKPLASLLLELPAREIGGQLPSWDELAALCELCRERGIRLHLDGARIWQAAPAYGRSLAEIGALFDSIYVSFYKDIGALPGAMLIGPADFIDEAAIWQRRQGGTLFTAMSNIVSARMRLGACIDQMPRRIARAREVAAMFAQVPRAQVLPDPPHTNMFHLTLRGEVDKLLAARDRAARETGIWLFGHLRAVEMPGDESDMGARTEITIGSAALDLGDAELEAAIAILLDA